MGASPLLLTFNNDGASLRAIKNKNDATPSGECKSKEVSTLLCLFDA